MLLEALERDKEYEMRGLIILYSVFGIRPCEIAKLEIKDGVRCRIDIRSKIRGN